MNSNLNFTDSTTFRGNSADGIGGGIVAFFTAVLSSLVTLLSETIQQMKLVEEL